MSTWPEMLDRVHATLAEAEARVAERERELEEPPLNSTMIDLETGWRQYVERWDARLRGLHNCAQTSEQKGAEADAALQAAESGLRELRLSADAARHKLAELASIPVR